MRVLLSSSSKKKFYQALKKKYECNSIKELSLKLKIPVKTLDSWFYKRQRLIPLSFLEGNGLTNFKIIKKQNSNWGQSLGGKNSYLKTLNEKGIEEIKRRQSLGGKNASITKEKKEKEAFSVDLGDSIFLEFYGALMGDGWLNGSEKGNKWQIGLCGNFKLDKEYILFMKGNVLRMFDRRGYIYNYEERNVMNFLFRHKLLFQYLKNELGFPSGKKLSLKISDKIYNKGFNYVKHVIRGIFDTDGSFYLAKRKNKNLYPMISIHMNSPVLIKQIGEILKENGFKAHYCNQGKMVRLSGSIQLKKWLEEIGSSNKKHLDRISNFENMSKEK